VDIPSVLVIKKNSLLNQAMASILHSSGSRLKVITSSAIDVQGLASDIANHKPDVILLEESMTLANKDALTHLLMVYPNLRVIVASDDSNWLHIYRKKDMLMTRPGDLLNIIFTSD
jgi:DNA-binding NarL/FixJ family response regulator